MSYEDIIKEIEKAIKAGDVLAVTRLINHRNERTIRDYRRDLGIKQGRYTQIKSTFKHLKDLTEEEMDDIFEVGLSPKQINDKIKALK